MVKIKHIITTFLSFILCFCVSFQVVSADDRQPIYEKLEYIATDGNSVIDTETIVKNDITRLEFDCNITTSSNNHQIGCGGNDADVIFFTRGFVYLLSGSYKSVSFTIPINQRKLYIADTINNLIGYEDNLVSLTPTANESIDTFTIGARKHNGAYELGGKDIIYDFKVYENDVLIKHLIPIKRISDNEIGMLDILTNTFYSNKGSGSLTGQSKETPEYIYDDEPDNPDEPIIDVDLSETNSILTIIFVSLLFILFKNLVWGV